MVANALLCVSSASANWMTDCWRSGKDLSQRLACGSVCCNCAVDIFWVEIGTSGRASREEGLIPCPVLSVPLNLPSTISWKVSKLKGQAPRAWCPFVVIVVFLMSRRVSREPEFQY